MEEVSEEGIMAMEMVSATNQQAQKDDEIDKNSDKDLKKKKSNNDNDKDKDKSSSLLKSISELFTSPKKRSINNTFSGGGASTASPPSLPISELSCFANSVVSRCALILGTSPQELQNRFNVELPDNVRQPLIYARNLLEFCCYQALHVDTNRSDYLRDASFRRLTFDMMIAWEAPGFETDKLDDQEAPSPSKKETEDEDGWSLFYSSSTKMAVEVDNKKPVGPEAFARIAPACSIIADITTVHNLFDVLTSSSDHRLHFLIYDKYLRSLEKVIKSVINGVGPQSGSNLSLTENEIILDVDGTVPTQPVLQHVGISGWPGRLTLTNLALYFESGVGFLDKAVRYDLATDMKQVIKPELTGPLGARLFDKGVMYKSLTTAEPVFFEFPEFKGSSRRDYWLDISLEILRAHKFIRRYNLKDNQQSEALGRAILGIFRYRAVREAFHISPTSYKTLLCFNLSESLPRGDLILENISRRLSVMSPRAVQRDISGSPKNSKKQILSPVALLTLYRLGIVVSKESVVGDGELTFQVGDVSVGEINPLEVAVRESKLDTGRAEAAQASVDQVKVEGIDTNLAVLKELLFPLVGLYKWSQMLVSWKNPSLSMVFMLLISYLIVRGWIKYILPCIFVCVAFILMWRRHVKSWKPLEALKIKAPTSKNAVEQLLTLQDAITQGEALIQTCNIVLLKVRALLYAVVPQATDKVVVSLIILAGVFAFVPIKYLILLVFLEYYTRSMPVREDSSDKWLRRIREWWIRIPAAPVLLIRDDDKKKK